MTPPPSGPATPATLVMAADGSGDLLTIAEAVAAATDGDTILVRPGACAESIVVDKDVTIRGDGERDDVILITPAEGDSALMLDHVEATLSGFTLRGDRAGVEIRGRAPVLDGLLLDHVGGPFKSGLPGDGVPIWLLDGSRATIRDSRFTVTADIVIKGDSSPRVTPHRPSRTTP